MKLLLTAIINRSPDKSFAALTDLYQSRIAVYSAVESVFFRSEKNFFDWVDKQRSRVIPLSVFLDSRGKPFTSEQFADWLGKQRDQGQRPSSSPLVPQMAGPKRRASARIFSCHLGR